MRILFEDQKYPANVLESYGLDPYMCIDRRQEWATLPYVGYVYSPKINDSIFILPKVFLFEGKGNAENGEVAFGKWHYNEVMEVTEENDPLKEDGVDRVLFGLSTWIYRAIDRYSQRHPESGIIRRTYSKLVSSNKGKEQQTLLDTILSLIAFHRRHASLFTYISIINNSGNDNIHWGRTISKSQPIIQHGVPIYADFKVRDKAVNYDEELIVLFYSVLEYLRAKYYFPVHANLNYDLIKPSKIESMIDSGRGTKMLRAIRKKYFKDELVLLWKLLYAFFDKAEVIRSGKYQEEALLARTFYHVFEDMVDCLISDDEYGELKANEDGKTIDHLYKDESLLGKGLIYYIGDSKYYFSDRDIESKSLSKQFTYAKNIIQLNINIENKPECQRDASEKRIISGVHYRDNDTEGYNITPNFFIRGYIKAEDIAAGHANYTEHRFQESKQKMPVNTHFENRLFDRDTLLLQAYNINFLFVLAAYVNSTDNDAVKKHIHDVIRDSQIKVFDKKYDFFSVTPCGSMREFIKKHADDYRGKMFHNDSEDFIWLACEKGTTSLEDLHLKMGNEATIEIASLCWSMK